MAQKLKLKTKNAISKSQSIVHENGMKKGLLELQYYTFLMIRLNNNAESILFFLEIKTWKGFNY